MSQNMEEKNWYKLTLKLWPGIAEYSLPWRMQATIVILSLVKLLFFEAKVTMGAALGNSTAALKFDANRRKE